MKTSSARFKKGSVIMIVFICLVIASIAVLAFISFKILPASKANVDQVVKNPVVKTATETGSLKQGQSSPTPSPMLPSCLPNPKGECMKLSKP